MRKVLTAESNLLLACAQSYCNKGVKRDIHSLIQVDWNTFNALAGKHNMIAPVSARLLQDDIAESLPQTQRLVFKKTIYSAVKYDIEYREWFFSVLDMINSSGIAPLVLKGLPLAESLYQKSYLRPSSDIDLLVKPEQLVTVGLVLKNKGYHLIHNLPAKIDELKNVDFSPLIEGEMRTSKPNHSRLFDYHLSFRRDDGRIVELHWKPAPLRAMAIPLDEIWFSSAAVKTGDREIYVLSGEHQLLLMLLHMITHGWLDGSLRNFLDISLFISTQKFSQAEILDALKKQKARGHAFHILKWIRDYMQIDVNDEMLYDLAPAPYETWSSRPFKSFEEMMALDQGGRRFITVPDIAEGLSAMRSAKDKSLFLLGIIAPPLDGLSQMRGSHSKWRLMLDYILRPISFLRGKFFDKRNDSEVAIDGAKLKNNIKKQISQESRIFRSLERVNSRGTALRRKGGIAGLIGKTVNFIFARTFDLAAIFKLTVKRIVMRPDLNALAKQLTFEADENEKIFRLNEFVFENIAYARSFAWLEPEDVIRLGFGDCKCQSKLLQALLEKVGIESKVVVGVTGHRSNKPGIHAWVEFPSYKGLICDPTLRPGPIKVSEYAEIMGGVLDVSEEYALKHFGSVNRH